MTFAPRRLAISVCALAVPMMLAAACPAFATAPGSYLSWQNKTPQTAPTPAPTVNSGGETYPVPPSPYGQVGDPYARGLSWPGKGAKPAPQPQPQPLANIDVPPPPAAELPKGPVSLSSPVPMAKPAPVRVPDRAVETPPAPKPAPQAMKPIPDPVPAAPKVAAKTAKPPAQPAVPQAPTPAAQATNDGGYQVPATSKYAARIASARAAQPQDAPPAPQQQAAKAKSGHTATAPASSEPLAAQETDHVFIPGEQYTNAQDAPRLYSLHRAYGLAPDPITVDRNATGAILESADLNADEGPPKDGDPKDGKDDTSDKSDTSADRKAQP